MIKNPIKSIAMGPAKNLDEKADVLLHTINLYVLRNDPTYCKKIINNVEWMYSKSNKEMPFEIKKKIYEIRKMIKGQ